MACIGIDFGVATCMAAVHDSYGPRVIKDMRGNEVIDAYVGIDPETQNPCVGEKAKSIFKSTPGLVAEQIGLWMGEPVDIEFASKEVRYQKLSTEEIAAQLFRHLKRFADAQLEVEVSSCAVTVPVHFQDYARRSTQWAGEIAGMSVERIISGPTAAALAYEHDESVEGEYVMVYDLGRRSFNVSIVRRAEDDSGVEASSGDTLFGVKDLDEELLWYVAEKFSQKHDISVEPGSGNYYRLLHECENVRNELAHSRETSAHIPFFAVKDQDPVDLHVEISQSEYEDLIGPLLAETASSVEKVLDAAGLARSDLGAVILVGEGVRVPYVESFVQHTTGHSPLSQIDPVKVVALGAARIAGNIEKSTDYLTPGSNQQGRYEVLGIPINASISEIEKAFYRKVREHPPEQDPEEHNRIRKAYDALTTKKRKNSEQNWKESDYYEGVKALFQVAKDELDSDFETEKEEQLRSLLDVMKRALAENDGERVHVLEEKITNVLFELL